jgi:hypothetical protein
LRSRKPHNKISGVCMRNHCFTTFVSDSVPYLKLIKPDDFQNELCR